MKRIAIVLSILIFLLVTSVSAQSGQAIRTYAKKICVSPTVTADAYAAGNNMGGKLTFALAGRDRLGTGIVTGIVLSDLAAAGKQIELVLFNTNPTGTTFTDKAALDIADADLTKIAGSGLIYDFSAFADNGIGQAGPIAIPFDTGRSSSATYALYGALVAREAITPASTSDFQVCIYVQQD